MRHVRRLQEIRAIQVDLAICIQIDEFLALELMNCALELMGLASKFVSSALKMLKMLKMICAIQRHNVQEGIGDAAGTDETVAEMYLLRTRLLQDYYKITTELIE